MRCCAWLPADSLGILDSVDPEALRNITQSPGLAIVRRSRSWIAHDHRPVALVADPQASRAPEAPLDIDLAAERAHEVSLTVLVKFDDSHATPRLLRTPSVGPSSLVRGGSDE